VLRALSNVSPPSIARSSAQLPRRVAIEAGVPDLVSLRRFDGKVIGSHRFGLSAPGDQVMKEMGIDAQHVIEAARSL
jgi:transketolase